MLCTEHDICSVDQAKLRNAHTLPEKDCDCSVKTFSFYFTKIFFVFVFLLTVIVIVAVVMSLCEGMHQRVSTMGTSPTLVMCGALVSHFGRCSVLESLPMEKRKALR